MPVNTHLKWVEVKDFTKGLWNGQDMLMPADAFQTMTDCYPRVSGGLRAFFKPTTTTLTTSGVDDTTNERIIWIAPLTVSTGTNYLMLTKHISTGQMKGYFWGIGDSAWTKQKTFTAHGDGYANGAIANVITYHDNTNGRNVWIVSTSHNKSDGTEDGWWLVRWDTNSWTQINTTAFLGPPVVQYQSRILGPSLNTLWWTDPGAIATPPAANFLTVQSGNNDSRDIIVGLVPYSPSTLMLATVGSGWFMIEGDITDPVVREMGKDHNAGLAQKMVVTENGVIFQEPEVGLFTTQNMGANFTDLDNMLLPFANDSSQGLGYQNGFVFAPTGRVLDSETGAWFTVSDAATSYNAFELPISSINGVILNRSVMIPQFKATPSILFYNLQERNGARAESYTVKSSPIRGDNGRLVYMREVQVGLDSFSSEATVAVTCNGTTQTSAALGTGRNVVSFLFHEHAEYLDVQFVVASNHSGVEAPILEYFRLGTRPDGHQIHY